MLQLQLIPIIEIIELFNHPSISRTHTTTAIPTRYLQFEFNVYDYFRRTFVVVPMWSCAAIGGTRLREVAPKCGLDGDPENWAQMHRDVVNR